MPTGGVSQREEQTVVLPDWVMLGSVGRTTCHNGLDAARVAVNENKTAAPLDMDGGRPSCYMSFTLAAPQKGVSYLNLHWPKEQDADHPPAYPYVRATDKDLVLFDISIPPRRPRYLRAPPDLFVYSAVPSPSVQRLPRCTTKDMNMPFLMNKRTTGILRLTEDCYFVADIDVYPEAGDMCAELCVFNSVSKEWHITPKLYAPQPQDHSNGCQLPNLWSADDVLAYRGCFLCWIDYFSGVLLCDFSKSMELRFIPFPGENVYHDEVRVERYFPQRFRSVSISLGKMCFVHIDNDFHDRLHNGWQHLQLPERSHGKQKQKISIWTLNSKYEWELKHVIDLPRLWMQPTYQLLGICHRLPEYPFISTDDPHVLCCMLREKEFGGKVWMIMVDNHGCLRSCTPEPESLDPEAGLDHFLSTPLLPTVFCKHLQRPTGVTWDNNKAVTDRSEKHNRPKRFRSKNYK